MGGLLSPKMPKPLPLPARAITAITKTPDLELVDDALKTGKRNRKALRTELLDQMSAQVSSAASGLQIPRGS
jgi:hypothetical protein